MTMTMTYSRSSPTPEMIGADLNRRARPGCSILPSSSPGSWVTELVLGATLAPALRLLGLPKETAQR
jgi:hypothetical protein